MFTFGIICTIFVQPRISEGKLISLNGGQGHSSPLLFNSERII